MLKDFREGRRAIVSTAVLLLTVAVTASAEPNTAPLQARDAVIGQVTLRGTVEAIDHTARTVTIRGQQGNVVTLDVPASVVRFDQVKVGDSITATYYDRINVRMKPAGEPDVDRTVEPTTTATPGALPGATVARQRIATVKVTAWDAATRMVSFTGPKGASYTRQLAETLDPSGLTGLKAGDRVDITWTEALTLSMQAAPAVQPPDEDSFRHRLTISALWGLDNQFSGKMIQEATGRTTGGVPINLDETTFDDVYGRMALFKIGVGYRTSPRSEAVINFVIERSSAETVQIGTISNASVPLFVDFGDYNYWGFDGGQRFFFTRVRFTPYVGYLVGINRFDEITGTFVNVPPNLTPGLAANDGKFFDSSWAFSLGPTGGILIGIGPIEVMAETQLRYMGGLSDVDWLVEEGLRDINTESSRWSWPILFGARIRL
jgi:hypothetical protein